MSHSYLKYFFAVIPLQLRYFQHLKTFMGFSWHFVPHVKVYFQVWVLLMHVAYNASASVFLFLMSQQIQSENFFNLQVNKKDFRKVSDVSTDIVTLRDK